ncbi:hypothetical protein BT96DRAFT_1091324, partial [Gymnopus androsaceus JB14]
SGKTTYFWRDSRCYPAHHDWKAAGGGWSTIRNLHAENNKPETCQVLLHVFFILSSFLTVYCWILSLGSIMLSLSPEIMNGPVCQDLWTHTKVTNRFYVVFDEGSFVNQWRSTFQNQYLHVGNIHYLLPENIPFYVTSATLPPIFFVHVSEILHLHTGNRLACFHDSNDRSNIHIVVRGIKYPVGEDLALLIPSNFRNGDPPPDNTTSCEDAIHYLRTLPPLRAS